MQLAPMVPRGLHGLIKIVENWTFSLFFCFAELWGSVVIAVLFWSLANDVCTVPEAKTVYPMLGISANVALVAAGNFMKLLTATVLAGASTQAYLQTMVATIVVASVAMAAVRCGLASGMRRAAAKACLLCVPPPLDATLLGCIGACRGVAVRRRLRAMLRTHQ